MRYRQVIKVDGRKGFARRQYQKIARRKIRRALRKMA
jgi:hypothetical protein